MCFIFQLCVFLNRTELKNKLKLVGNEKPLGNLYLYIYSTNCISKLFGSITNKYSHFSITIIVIILLCVLPFSAFPVFISLPFYISFYFFLSFVCHTLSLSNFHFCLTICVFMYFKLNERDSVKGEFFWWCFCYILQYVKYFPFSHPNTVTLKEIL